MRLIDCVNAYTAVLALMDKECGFKVSYALVKLRRQLQPHVEFFLNEEAKLLLRYAAKKDGKPVYTAKGKVRFERPEDGVEYNAKWNELAAVAVSESFNPVRLCLPDEVSVKPAHLDYLSDFVIFEEVEAHG